MKLSTVLATFAPLAMVQAQFSAVFFYDSKDGCDTSPVLAEYNTARECTGACTPLETNTDYVWKDQCEIADYDTSVTQFFGTAKHVTIEFFIVGSKCDGDATSIIATLPTGECYPTYGYTTVEDDKSVQSLQVSATEAGEASITVFSDAKCGEKIGSYDVGAKAVEDYSCVLDFMKVNVASGATDSNSTMGDSDDNTTAGSNNTGGSAGADPSVTEPTPTAPEPSPSSASSLAMASLSVVAAAAASLF